MASAIHHAESSARKWGGRAEDTIHIHEWFDDTKNHIPDMRHRALRHHSLGIQECIDRFGQKVCLRKNDGTILKWIPTRWVAEQHVLEDMGCIPTVADWFREMPMNPRFMAARAQKGERIAGLEAGK